MADTEKAMQKKLTKSRSPSRRRPGAALLLATGAAAAVIGFAAFSAEAALAPDTQPFANATQPNPKAVKPMAVKPMAVKHERLVEGANPCHPCGPSEAATKLCFDLDVGRPVPCTSKHTEEAQPDVRDFMTPHSGPRGNAK